MKTIYSLAVFFLILQIVNCEKTKHCKDDKHCLVDSSLQKLKDKSLKSSNGKGSYEETYKKKFEKYSAARDKQEQSEIKRLPLGKTNDASEKDCSKRKYQLNCSKSWQKSKTGERSSKNGKVYIKRENNPLLNLDDDEKDLKRKKQKPQAKVKPTTFKTDEKRNKKYNFKPK